MIYPTFIGSSTNKLSDAAGKGDNAANSGALQHSVGVKSREENGDADSSIGTARYMLIVQVNSPISFGYTNGGSVGYR